MSCGTLSYLRHGKCVSRVTNQSTEVSTGPQEKWVVQITDATKEMFCDFRHRALRHHSQGVFEAERLFGHTIRNSDNKLVPVRCIAEQHIKEYCGGIIPSVSDWLSRIRPESWMSRGYTLPSSGQNTSET
jgi:hypothetical protein